MLTNRHHNSHSLAGISSSHRSVAVHPHRKLPSCTGLEMLPQVLSDRWLLHGMKHYRLAHVVVTLILLYLLHAAPLESAAHNGHVGRQWGARWILARERGCGGVRRFAVIKMQHGHSGVPMSGTETAVSSSICIL